MHLMWWHGTEARLYTATARLLRWSLTCRCFCVALLLPRGLLTSLSTSRPLSAFRLSANIIYSKLHGLPQVVTFPFSGFPGHLSSLHTELKDCATNTCQHICSRVFPRWGPWENANIKEVMCRAGLLPDRTQPQTCWIRLLLCSWKTGRVTPLM